MGPIQGTSPIPAMGPVSSTSNQANWQFRQAALPDAEPKLHIPRGKTELIARKIAQRVVAFFEPIHHSLSVKYQMLRMLVHGYSRTYTMDVINNSLDRHDNSLEELSKSVDFYRIIAGVTKKANTIRPDLPLIKDDVVEIFKFLLEKSGSDMAWSKIMFDVSVSYKDVTTLNSLTDLLNSIGHRKERQRQEEQSLTNQITTARRILGIADNGTLNRQMVRRAYRQAQLKWHPDKLGPAVTSETKEQHHQIQQAYQLLNEQLPKTKPQANRK